ncbi:MAG: ISNCY family transposase [Deltaproteobacteria bacterium]|nr:ISNCY family transposase [Deltaproteobacteria bacterium]
MKTIILTMKEQSRAAILSKLAGKKKERVTTGQIAQVLGLSERQVYRLKARYRKKGIFGLAHGNRGRRSRWKMPKRLEDRIVKLAQGKYAGFNDHHLAEKLCEVEGIEVSRSKVEKLLRSRGIAAVRKKRRPKHRTRRERKPRAGLLLQTDGSEHDWLEGRGPRLTFLGLIDDATNEVPFGFFDEAETTMGYFRLFYETFSRKGLPVSIYADRHTIFQTWRKPTVEEQLENKRPETQMGRALRELGITLIPAYSSQAKGRIERCWGTFQDRLVSELRLVKADNKEKANQAAGQFIPRHNRRFTRKPADETPAWRPIPKGIDLLQILCVKEQRVAANDNTISWHGQTLQIPKSKIRPSFAKVRVDVHHLINGEVHLFYKKGCIAKFSSETIALNDRRRTQTNQDGLGYTQKSQAKEEGKKNGGFKNGASEPVKPDLAEAANTGWGIQSIWRPSEKAGLGPSPNRTCYGLTGERKPFLNPNTLYSDT